VPLGKPRIDVLTRGDRGSPLRIDTAAILTSSHERLGIDDVRRAIIAAVQRLAPRGPTATLRMRVGVEEAREEILRSQASAGAAGRDEALVAGHLGRAVAAIGAITGQDMAADLLDRIFERHCIGK
jgi:tRNA U34 5-carboxymethylaminomethyl modifying GTPase MnmE/TrmE